MIWWLPFLYHHRWSKSKQLSFTMKDSCFFPVSLSKYSRLFIILTSLNLVHMFMTAVMRKVPTWCMAYLNQNAFVLGSFSKPALRRVKHIAVWRDCNSFSLCWFSIFTCLTHLSVWSRTSLGAMEDWASCCAALHLLNALFLHLNGQRRKVPRSCSVRKLLFLSFIVKYKSLWNKNVNVRRKMEKDVPLIPQRLF